MTDEELLASCLSLPGAYIDYPFGPFPVCVKVQGHIFAQLYPDPADHKVTFKCEPMQGDLDRQTYPGAITRGYHCPPVQQPFWNTVLLDGAVPDADLRRMIGQAYRAVAAKLPKRQREELGAPPPDPRPISLEKEIGAKKSTRQNMAAQ